MIAGTGSSWISVLLSFLPLLLLVGFFVWTGRQTRNQLSGGGALGGIGRSRAKITDAERPVDPARPDENALDYWSREALALHLRYLTAIGMQGVVDLTFYYTGSNAMLWLARHGVGTAAAKAGRQVYFDSGRFKELGDPDPKGSMLRAANQMVDEALEAASRRERVAA